MQKSDIAQIEEKLGYKFKNKAILEQAFIHSSYGNLENVDDNERMEFLGDSILSFIVSQYLFGKYPEFDAGMLSKARSSVVSAKALRPIVEKLGIIEYLCVVGRDDVRTLSGKIFANLYEAVLCAIYFDGGLSHARQFVMNTLKDILDDIKSYSVEQDCKTLVQEYCQEHKIALEYKFDNKIGPDNQPTFYYSLWLDGKKVSSGVGANIKDAERDAASKIVKEWGIS